ncbi:MAG: MBL fold metallo-hydrolase [Lachnospiraceae bacterium]|nr:MBL fold metallo-hydrolase [Lachnospiraceae bacterium]
MILVVLLIINILYQALMLFRKMPLEFRETVAVPIAKKMISNGIFHEETGLFPNNIWSGVMAGISRITGISVSTAAHTVIPPLILILSYLSVFVFLHIYSKESLKVNGEEKRFIINSLSLFSIVVLIGGAVSSSFGATLFLRGWWWESVAACVFIPLFFMGINTISPLSPSKCVLLGLSVLFTVLLNPGYSIILLVMIVTSVVTGIFIKGHLMTRLLTALLESGVICLNPLSYGFLKSFLQLKHPETLWIVLLEIIICAAIGRQFTIREQLKKIPFAPVVIALIFVINITSLMGVLPKSKLFIYNHLKVAPNVTKINAETFEIAGILGQLQNEEASINQSHFQDSEEVSGNIQESQNSTEISDDANDSSHEPGITVDTQESLNKPGTPNDAQDSITDILSDNKPVSHNSYGFYGKAAILCEQENIPEQCLDTLNMFALPDNTILEKSPNSKELKDFFNLLNDNGVSILVCDDNPDKTRVLAANGWYIKKRFEGYNFFKKATTVETDFSSNEWIMTQFSDESKNQGMFYAIYNLNEEKLVLIDGGSPENEETVRNIIHTYSKDHVDCWFLTHYHADHIGAFNRISWDYGDITVDKIVVPEIDRNYYKLIAQSYDTIEEFDNFYITSATNSVVSAARRDDLVDYGSLTIEILNTYDDVLTTVEKKDIPNNCSLVLKIMGPEKSALICADCHTDAVSKMLINRYGTLLMSDIVQCGHHGNNSFPEKFYGYVNPKIALFDMPEEFMKREDLTAKDLQSFFKSIDVETFDYSTAPNAFSLGASCIN